MPTYFGARENPVANPESGPECLGECAQIPPFLRIAGEIPGVWADKKSA